MDQEKLKEKKTKKKKKIVLKILSKKEIGELVSLFNMLPAGRSERNHFSFTQEQAHAINRLRHQKTPKELELLLNISVYKIHKLILYARHLDKEQERKNKKIQRENEKNAKKLNENVEKIDEQINENVEKIDEKQTDNSECLAIPESKSNNNPPNLIDNFSVTMTEISEMTYEQWMGSRVDTTIIKNHADFIGEKNLKS